MRLGLRPRVVYPALPTPGRSTPRHARAARSECLSKGTLRWVIISCLTMGADVQEMCTGRRLPAHEKRGAILPFHRRGCSVPV